MQLLSGKRRLILAIGLIALLVGAGATAAAVALASGGAVSSSGPEAFVSTTSSAAEPISASSALSQVKASMAGSDVASAQIGAPPSDMPSSATSAAVPALYVTVKIPSLENGDTVEPFWEADLLQGAVVELAGSSASLKNDIGYVGFSGQLPDGTVIPNLGGGMGDIARGEQFAGSNDSDAAVRNAIDQAAAAHGFTVDSVSVFHVNGTAPAVVLTAPDISSVAANYQTLTDDLFGATPRYQGYYLEIRGAGGRPYVRRSVSFVTGSGRFWVDPSLDGTGTLPPH